MRNFGTNKDWDRAFWAPRTDAPLWATAVISQGVIALIVPPVAPPDRMHALLDKMKDRIERPHLAPGQRRNK